MRATRRRYSKKSLGKKSMKHRRRNTSGRRRRSRSRSTRRRSRRGGSRKLKGGTRHSKKVLDAKAVDKQLFGPWKNKPVNKEELEKIEAELKSSVNKLPNKNTAGKSRKPGDYDGALERRIRYQKLQIPIKGEGRYSSDKFKAAAMQAAREEAKRLYQEDGVELVMADTDQ